MLTREQAQLLSAYNPWMILETIVDQAVGIARIRDGCSGACWGTSRPNVPDWLQRYETEKGQIQGGTWEEPKKVVVTFTQLKRWAQELPDVMRDEARQLRAASAAESERTRKWCHCSDPKRCEESNRGDPIWGGRYHPTDEEDQDHLEICWEQRDRERDFLDRVLGLKGEPVGQLDLFGDLMEASS